MQIINSKDAAKDFQPICPHCEKELDTIYRVEDQKGFFQGHLGYCFACPYCRKVLGFSDYSS